MIERVRLFWGLSCPYFPAERMLQDELRHSSAGQVAGLTLVPERNLHVTLRYVGAVDANDVASIRDCIQPLIESCSTFSLQLCGVGRFSRALWVSVDAPFRLYRLVQRIDTALTEAGFSGDPKPFRPHVTIARLGRGITLPVREWEERHMGRPFGEWSVDTVHLYRSDIGPQGSRYTPVVSVPLRKD